MLSNQNPGAPLIEAGPAELSGADGRAFGAGKWLCFAALVTPLVLVPGVLFPYVTTRAIFFHVVAQLGLGLVLFLVLRRHTRTTWRNDRVLQALLIFLVTQLVAALAGESALRSIFGDFERMWGVWGWAHLIAYYILLRIFLRRADWSDFWHVAVAVGVGVAGFGVLSDATGPGGFHVQAISTVGNSGLFGACCFWTAGLVALLFVRERDRRRRIMYALAGLLALGGAIVSQNRSAFIALAVAISTFVLVRSRRRLRDGALLAGIFAIAAVAIIERGQTKPLPGVLGRISTTRVSLVSVRALQARATVLGVREHPLLGVGPENFDLLWSRHFDPAVYRIDVDERWDREHNAFLEAVATSGLLGGAAFVLIWVALFAALLRAYQRQDLSLLETGVCAAMYAGYAAYLLFWFVDLNSLIPFVAMAAFVSTAADGNLVTIEGPRPWRPASSVILALGALMLVVIVYLHDAEPLRVARALVLVERNGPSVEDTLRELYFAFDSPAPQRSHTLIVYATYMEKLTPVLGTARANWYQHQVLDLAFHRGAIEFERQIAREPENPRLLLLRARFYILAAYFYGNRALYGLAEKDLRHAIALSPRRIPPRLVLSGVRIALGDTAGALSEARRAVAILPEFGEAHFYLGQDLIGSSTMADAAEELQRSLALGYVGRSVTFRRAAFHLEQQGSCAQAADLLTAYLTKKYAPLDAWARQRPSPKMRDNADSAILLALPVTDSVCGRDAAALVAAAALSIALPNTPPRALTAP